MTHFTSECIPSKQKIDYQYSKMIISEDIMKQHAFNMYQGILAKEHANNLRLCS